MAKIFLDSPPIQVHPGGTVRSEAFQGRRAGQSTRNLAFYRYKTRFRFVLVMIGVVILLLLVAAYSKPIGIGGFGFLIVALFVRFVMDWTDKKEARLINLEKRAIRGAKAEEGIGLILDQLGRDEFIIVHDVVSPFGNIDHIVIGKHTGLFLIETKAHGGTIAIRDGRVLINGHNTEKDFIAQVLKNTYWLRDKIRQDLGIDVWITPVLVFTNAFVPSLDPLKGIRIINKRYLLNVLQGTQRKSIFPIWGNAEVFRRCLDA